MKRFGILLMLLSLFCLPCSAAQLPDMTVTASQTELKRGDEVTVNFAVTEQVQHCISGVYGFVFDSTVFEFVDGSCSAKAALSGTDMQGELVTGFFRYVGLLDKVSEADIPAGTLYTLTLRVKADAPFGDTVITGEDCSFTTAEEAIPINPGMQTLKIICIHSWGAWTKPDAVTQQRSCSICQQEERITQGESTPTEGTDPTDTTDPSAPSTEETIATPNNHKLRSVQASPATHSGPGCIAHFVCTDCSRLFADPLATQELTADAVALPRLPHVFSENYTYDTQAHWHICSCGEKTEPVHHGWQSGNNHTQFCICGASKNENSPAEPAQVQQNNYVLPVVIVLAVLEIGAAAAFLLIRRKNNR